MYTEARHWFLGYKAHSAPQILVLKADRSSRLQVLMWMVTHRSDYYTHRCSIRFLKELRFFPL